MRVASICATLALLCASIQTAHIATTQLQHQSETIPQFEIKTQSESIINSISAEAILEQDMPAFEAQLAADRAAAAQARATVAEKHSPPPHSFPAVYSRKTAVIDQQFSDATQQPSATTESDAPNQEGSTPQVTVNRQSTPTESQPTSESSRKPSQIHQPADGSIALPLAPEYALFSIPAVAAQTEATPANQDPLNQVDPTSATDPQVETPAPAPVAVVAAPAATPVAAASVAAPAAAPAIPRLYLDRQSLTFDISSDDSLGFKQSAHVFRFISVGLPILFLIACVSYFIWSYRRAVEQRQATYGGGSYKSKSNTGYSRQIDEKSSTNSRKGSASTGLLTKITSIFKSK
jgi:hypothetical protein